MKWLFLLSLFSHLAMADFPDDANYPDRVDPFTGKTYDKVAIGKSHNKGENKLWRHVIFYNVKTVESPVVDMPWFEEDCWDHSNRFANWLGSITIKKTFKGDMTFEALGFEFGLGVARTKETKVQFQRYVQAFEGIHARHYLYQQSQTFKGVSLKQFYDKKKKRVYLRDRKDRKGFLLTNLVPGLFVKREIQSSCL